MIHPLKSAVSDNWFYLLTGPRGAVLVDPIDPPVAIRAVETAGVPLVAVLNTHWHPDHVAGDDGVLEAFPDAMLVVPRAEVQKIRDLVRHGVDRVISGGDTVDVGGDSWGVIDTPGHTFGHVSLRRGSEVVVGDTMFAAGAGNCGSGDPKVLFATYDAVISRFEDGVRLYPGHDYAVRNLEFAASIARTDAVAVALASARQRSGFEPLHMGQERATNPFLRAFESDYQDLVCAHAPSIWESWRPRTHSKAETAFCALRELRNSW